MKDWLPWAQERSEELDTVSVEETSSLEEEVYNICGYIASDVKDPSYSAVVRNVVNGVVFFQGQDMVPMSLRWQVQDSLNSGHQGVTYVTSSTKDSMGKYEELKSDVFHGNTGAEELELVEAREDVSALNQNGNHNVFLLCLEESNVERISILEVCCYDGRRVLISILMVSCCEN